MIGHLPPDYSGARYRDSTNKSKLGPSSLTDIALASRLLHITLLELPSKIEKRLAESTLLQARWGQLG
jgi:hypothetical protein